MTPYRQQTHLRDFNGRLWCRRDANGLDVAFTEDFFTHLPYGQRCPDCLYRLQQFKASSSYNPNSKPCPRAPKETTP